MFDITSKDSILSTKTFIPNTLIEIFPSNLGNIILDFSVYEEGNISWGYGQSTGIAIEIGNGVAVDLNIDLNLKTISAEGFNNWKSSTFPFFTTEQQQNLKSTDSVGQAANYLGISSSIIFGDGKPNFFENNNNSPIRANNTLQKDFLESLYGLELLNFNIKGNIKATGTSETPTRVKICFITYSFTFSDGKKLLAINTDNPVAAQLDGNTQGVTTQKLSELQIIPI